jgi:predicted DNA-binding protein (MmcQ/YjbR family)
VAFRVGGRIFALCILEREPFQFNLKCDPELAEILRHAYPRAVRSGYHMNKRHWVTVVPNGSLTPKQIRQMIDHSYDRVVGGLSVAARRALGRLRRH